MAVSALTLRLVADRAARRLLDAPRAGPDESALGPSLDALGGEIVRIRSRDGLRLSARWLPSEADGTDWQRDPHDAILLLHGYTGSVAPDLVEYGPFLRTTAGVLGLDFGGHGESDPAPTTFGLREVEDVAGALAWLGSARHPDAWRWSAPRWVGSRRSPPSPSSATGPSPRPTTGPTRRRGPPPTSDRGSSPSSRTRSRPRAVVPVASRLPGPAPTFVAERLFDSAARTLDGDPRATDPIKVIGLVEPVPLLLIHGLADATVPIADGRRLAAAAGPSAQHWVVPGADHSAAHATAPAEYERRVTQFLRNAFASVRTEAPIIGAPGPDSDPDDPATAVPADPMED